jgi:hypothetical protein
LELNPAYLKKLLSFKLQNQHNMEQKLMVNLTAAAVPVVVGAIWYNPYLLGAIWGGTAGIAKEKMNPGRVLLTIALTYIAGYYIAGSLGSIVIHQHGLYGMLAGDPDMKDKTSALAQTVQGLMDKYGHNYRTFKHGAYHGMWTGICFILPVLVIIGFTECKKITWILIHAAFWVICLALMGGIICEYMP